MPYRLAIALCVCRFLSATGVIIPHLRKNASFFSRQEKKVFCLACYNGKLPDLPGALAQSAGSPGYICGFCTGLGARPVGILPGEGSCARIERMSGLTSESGITEEVCRTQIQLSQRRRKKMAFNVRKISEYCLNNVMPLTAGLLWGWGRVDS